MADLKLAILGTGWWSTFQIPAWLEVGGVQLVALQDRTRAKAEEAAARYNVPHVYDDAEELFQREQPDLVDIIAGTDAHAPLVELAARYGVPVICQKPMAGDYATCERMVQTCRAAGVPFMVHENLRWQAPIRELRRILAEGQIGRPFRARLQTIGYSPSEYIEQPFLKTLERLILTDMGSHVLDVARFLFDEPQTLYCQHTRTRDDIRGEDVATVLLRCSEVICTCEMSSATRTEWGHYPDLFAFIEGTRGSVELAPDYWLRVTTDDGTWARRCEPPLYAWARADQPHWHASMVPCIANLLQAIRTGQPAETSGEDNLKTMRLVYGAYESAEQNRVLTLE